MQRRDFLKRAGGAIALTGLAGDLMATETGLSVPAEEGLHQRTFMQWPNSRAVYEDEAFLRLTQATIAEIANTISQFEPVTLLAAGDHHARIGRMVSGAVALWDIPTEDLWCRDAGPLFARRADGTLAISHLQFNGWGGKQVNHHDSRIAARVAERLGLDLVPSGVVGEAGGVEFDGQTLLIAHESSWVNENRNPGLTRDDIETRLKAAYGASRMIWTPGLRGEDITDYHIDSLARFTGPNRVLVNLPDAPDPADPFHMAALETHDALVAAGVEVGVIPDPWNRRVDSLDFVASYANYYVCNGAVIAAEFGDAETDEIARDALARHYPGREVVMLNVDPLGELGGGIHCATQQMPE